MKYIFLERVPLGDEREFDYREQLLEYAQLGFKDRSVSTAEIEEMHPVIDKLSKTNAGTWLELENAEHKALLAKMDALGFVSSHQIICEFYRAVKYAASEKPASQAVSA